MLPRSQIAWFINVFTRACLFPIPSVLCVCTLTSPPPSAYIFLFSLQLVGFFKPREGPAVLDFQSHVFSRSPRLAENTDYTDLRLVCVRKMFSCCRAASDGGKKTHPSAYDVHLSFMSCIALYSWEVWCIQLVRKIIHFSSVLCWSQWWDLRAQAALPLLFFPTYLEALLNCQLRTRGG